MVNESSNKLNENLKTFYDKMDERCQYLEGLVHAFDAMSRLANPKVLTPFERENFIGSAKSWAYSKIYHLNLNPKKHMKGLVESDGKYVYACLLFAELIHNIIGEPLTFEQKMRLKNMELVATIES